MQTIKKGAAADVVNRAAAINKNKQNKSHYYNTISEVVFTSGVLCPACKRGHLHSINKSKTFKIYTSNGSVQWITKRVKRCDRCISIHAPSVGSDLKTKRKSCKTKDFNPRSQCWERLNWLMGSLY